MKANEAPEKIHVQPNAHDKWFEGKIPNGLPNGLFVEYNRTDIFIEKACDFMKANIDHYIGHYLNNDDTYLDDSFIEDFKKYMEE